MKLVIPPDDEIAPALDRCLSERERGVRRRESYQEGVLAAILWLTGKTTANPMDADPRPPLAPLSHR